MTYSSVRLDSYGNDTITSHKCQECAGEAMTVDRAVLAGRDLSRSSGKLRLMLGLEPRQTRDIAIHIHS